jgi:Flp pilus assembly protein TadD
LDPRAVLQEALRHHGAGDLARAEALYQQVLAVQPDHPDALHLLGVSAIQRQHFARAEQLLAAAVRVRPDNADYHSNLGVALRALGRDEDAAHAFERALALVPGHDNAGYNLAIAQRNLGRLDEAVRSMRAAVARAPGAAERHCDLAGLLLESGQFAPALAACDACLALTPRDALAMSYKAVALGQCGADDAALWAMDRTVRARRIPLPPHWRSEDALCAALARLVLEHPSLDTPRARATTHGRQTGELLGGDDPAARALGALIDTAVADYLQGLPLDPGHPWLAHRPPRWSLTAWGVVLDDQGHQVAHAHPSGWVSGVLYVVLPATIAADDAAHAGWIEFGRPPDEFPLALPPQVQLLAPERGMLVLFPSYLYHRTIPVHAAGPRISIAFDARPIW